MISKQIRFSIYLIIAALLFATFLLKDSGKGNSLPLLGTIPKFKFIDSEENLISRHDLNGKVWVADFIFYDLHNGMSSYDRKYELNS